METRTLKVRVHPTIRAGATYKVLGREFHPVQILKKIWSPRKMEVHPYETNALGESSFPKDRKRKIAISSGSKSFWGERVLISKYTNRVTWQRVLWSGWRNSASARDKNRLIWISGLCFIIMLKWFSHSPTIRASYAVIISSSSERNISPSIII